MTIYQLCGGVVAALLVYLFLKNFNDRFANLAVVAGGILIVLYVVGQVTPLLSFADTLAEYAGVKNEYFQSIIKGLAVCYLGELTAGACKDCGVGGWAEKVELACRCSLLILALPLFEEFLGMLVGILK